MDPVIADQNSWRGSGVGTALKAGGSTGFEGLLGGMCIGNTGNCYNYSGTNEYGYFWTSTMGTQGPWRRCLAGDAVTAWPSDTVGRWQTWPWYYALPVRCVRDL